MAALSKESSLKGPAAAARARKRRIALRKQNASMDEVIDGGASPKRSTSKKTSSDATTLLVDPVTNKPKPSITGIKKQSRYMPGVPMTKEELKAWRKEARRVRNRESAAASRRRNRDRIGVLEAEVDAMKSKYAAALKHILDLEAGTSDSSFTPQVLRQDLMEARTQEVPQVSCGTALTLNAVEQHEMECIGSGGIAPHIMIPRTTAACVLIPP
jgi:chromosome segregation ATPase